MTPLQFNYRDVFRSARLALHPQRIWTQFMGLAAGWFGYLVLTYLSLTAGGLTLSAAWARFGLIPSAAGLDLPLFSRIIAWAGCLFFIFWWLAAATAVARAVYMDVKGNSFYTAKAAWRFALKRKGGAVISSPLTILVIIGLVLLGGYLVGLLGRIPVLGEVGIPLFTLLWYAVSFFLIYLVLALGVSLIITPAVVATTDDDAFEGIFQSFALLHGQPWRLVLYEGILLAVSLAALGILAFFAKQAWQVMNTILIAGMGGKFADISYHASCLVQDMIYPAVIRVKSVLGDYAGSFFFGEHFNSLGLSGVRLAGAWITAAAMLFAGGLIAAYPAAVFNSGQALVFIALKKIKERDNLLLRRDEEEAGNDETAEGAGPENVDERETAVQKDTE